MNEWVAHFYCKHRKQKIFSYIIVFVRFSLGWLLKNVFIYHKIYSLEFWIGHNYIAYSHKTIAFIRKTWVFDCCESTSRRILDCDALINISLADTVCDVHQRRDFAPGKYISADSNCASLYLQRATGFAHFFMLFTLHFGKLALLRLISFPFCRPARLLSYFSDHPKIKCGFMNLYLFHT